MTTLTIYRADGSGTIVGPLTDEAGIKAHLGALGVRFERWPTRTLADTADAEAVLEVYAGEIQHLKRENGYNAADVVRLARGAANVPELRAKFLDEHTHSEDEVRFFVEGSGAFYLRDDERVVQIICMQGDLISVPAGQRHWFDMGPDPVFTAVRLFTNKEGWVAQFTGDKIARRIPLYEAAAR